MHRVGEQQKDLLDIVDCAITNVLAETVATTTTSALTAAVALAFAAVTAAAAVAPATTTTPATMAATVTTTVEGRKQRRAAAASPAKWPDRPSQENEVCIKFASRPDASQGQRKEPSEKAS